MQPKDAEGIANSVDPDQTALGAVWSGSALFAQTCLSENLGKLRYLGKKNICVFQVSALKKLGMVGRHYHFILSKYFM